MSDVLDILTANPVRPAALLTINAGGKTFRCTRRTAAHLFWTQERLAAAHPDATLRIIQGCYNTGVAASAGTHDFDAVVDVEVVGLSWDDAQTFLRGCGWAAWVRSPPTFGWHIHMVSLGYSSHVGVYVPGQVADYYAHRTGLAGHADDPTWHPTDIASTIFDYPAWVRDQEDTMQDADWIKLRTVVREEIAAELDRTVDTKAGKRSVRQMVKETFQVVRGGKP